MCESDIKGAVLFQDSPKPKLPKILSGAHICDIKRRIKRVVENFRAQNISCAAKGNSTFYFLV
jgi:hypothetical protein